MNIAILFDSKVDVGGGYHQSLKLVQELNKHFSKKHRISVINTLKANKNIFAKMSVNEIYFNYSLKVKLTEYLRKSKVAKIILKKIRLFPLNPFDRLLKSNKIDLIIFTGQSIWALKTEIHNYAILAWDFDHRYHPEFPEVSKNGTFEHREKFYNRVLPKAVAVLVDSEISKRDALRYYCLEDNRVHILKYLPADFVNFNELLFKDQPINVKKKFNILNDYVFYPAQFWAHKNHVYILDALLLLKKNNNIIIDAVFVGSDAGNKSTVISYAQKLDIMNQIHFLGYVDDMYMPYLFTQSLALVMPTYFGPTNMPPIEAFSLNTPVIYTDLPEYIESYNNAMLKLDLADPTTLFDNLLLLINNPEIKKELISNGSEYINSLPQSSHFNVFSKIFDQYENKLKCWKS